MIYKEKLMIKNIKLKNVHKKYNTGNFVLDISHLEFKDHSINVLVGPNGSGKTTLLKLISLLERPDKGKILFNEKDILSGKNGTMFRKNIGYIMQNPYLFNRSVYDNVALGLKLRKYPSKEIKSKVNEILTYFQIEHLASKNIKYLSGGEHQKVAIAQVLVLEPEILLMDETTANIDRQSRVLIKKMIKQLHSKFNTLIIMTTHSSEQTFRTSHEIIILENGKIKRRDI